MDAVDKSPRKENLLVQNSKGKSYEISPYQCSDDEDEVDELPTKKYMPSWARCLLNSYENICVTRGCMKLLCLFSEDEEES